MFVSCLAWDKVMPILFTALPLIGALLLLENESQKRPLDKKENIAAILIFGGFILFVAWQGFLIHAIVGVTVFIGVFIHSVVRKRN